MASDQTRRDVAAPPGAAGTTGAVGLPSRSAMILREIVEAYVATGEPVGSRTLSRRLPMALSPATIRNVMADLEESGLIFAPHTSAGRLPTDRGLRMFVDGLLERGSLTPEEEEAISARCQAEGRSIEEVLAEASALLAGLSQAAGLVIAPKSEAALKHVEFVSLGSGRVLVVLVTEDGQVENRVIQPPRAFLPLPSTRPATMSTHGLPAARSRRRGVCSRRRSPPTAPSSTSSPARWWRRASPPRPARGGH